MSTRVCFTLRVRPDLLDEYRRLHDPVAPDMLQAIEASGRRNYSLFLHEDGLLIGYYEVDDDWAAQSFLAADPAATAWEARMQRYFFASERVDQSARRVPEIFHLADQLKALSS